MGQLHDRMKQDLFLAGKAASTQKKYLNNAKFFARYHMRPPEELGREDVREFLLYVVQERGVSSSTYNNYLFALRFLYDVTLGRPDVCQGIPKQSVKHQNPEVLTVAEVRTIFDATDSLYYRTLFRTAYSAGLRGNEVCRLEVGDIDSSSMLLCVRRGKGGKRRVVMLSPVLLDELRRYWRQLRPPGPWLFPRRVGRGERFGDEPARRDTVSAAFRSIRRRCGIDKAVSMHGLRRAFATHLIEAGVDSMIIQSLLGHARPETTAGYARVRTDLIRETPSPLDLMEKHHPR